MSTKQDGIYEKFRIDFDEPGNSHPTSDGRKVSVIRTDGRSEPGEKHHGCQYFVLDLDEFGAGVTAALDAYADACEADLPKLASDLRKMGTDDDFGAVAYFILDLDHDPYAVPAMAAFKASEQSSVSQAPTEGDDHE